MRSANRIFAQAYGANPKFFEFYRSMEAYKTALENSGTTMVLSPDSEFFRFFQNEAGQPGERQALPARTPTPTFDAVQASARHGQPRLAQAGDQGTGDVAPARNGTGAGNGAEQAERVKRDQRKCRLGRRSVRQYRAVRHRASWSVTGTCAPAVDSRDGNGDGNDTAGRTRTRRAVRTCGAMIA